MCGINGFNFEDQALIRRMNDANKHRGPDGTGVFCNDGVSLGHNRLSIIDPTEAAAQPMISNDARYVITYNGELYNFQELKSELIGSYNFQTSSDTEVVLASYIKWGAECLERFNGIFAFAIWDSTNKEVLLARDHVGVKPLYYFWDGRRFIFSSEIKSIMEHNIPRTLNKSALNHYLRVLYVPSPLTMFEGIRKLLPAHYMVLKNGQLFPPKQYWNPYGGELIMRHDPKMIRQTIQKKVLSAIERQLVSDKPLGLYLSGGIDSSVVLAAMKQVRPNVDTYSVGFDLTDEEEREKFNHDFLLAKKTADQFGTNHHEVMLSSDDAVDMLERAVWQLDEPISNATILPMMKIAEFAKQSVDVVLSGDGGDELFGGYERYRLSRLADIFQRFPLSLGKLIPGLPDKILKLYTAPGIDQFALFMFQKDRVLSRVVAGEYLNLSAASEAFNNRFSDFFAYKNGARSLMEIDQQSWLVDEALTRADKMSMAFGLEQRVPLLDREVIEYAITIDARLKATPFMTKKIFKDAFREYIPKYLYNQPKRGWFSPAAKWLRRPRMMDMVRSVLSPEYASEMAPVFQWDEIRSMLDDHIAGRKYNLTMLWALVIFQLWAKQYKVTLDQ